MSIRSLAQTLVQSNDDWNHTPVLVPVRLSLTRRFILALLDELTREISDKRGARENGVNPRALRIDWLRNGNTPWSVVSDPIARRWSNRVADRLSRGSGVSVDFQVTTTISRPCDHQREVVIGLCDKSQPLSPWTFPIYLGGSPPMQSALN